jgi:DNA-nicking Smr family endonuclease
MKRPPRRVASDAERQLFQETLRDAKPIAGKKRKTVSTPPRKAPEVRLHSAPIPTKPPPPRPTDREAPPIGGHREAHLRRGRLEPEARIDLHGHTQDQAYRALARLFARAHDRDQRLVLVITGKGGVLRGLVPQWLGESEFRRFVRGVSPAHIAHGGDGALYVLLRRKVGKAAPR